MSQQIKSSSGHRLMELTGITMFLMACLWHQLGGNFLQNLGNVLQAAGWALNQQPTYGIRRNPKLRFVERKKRVEMRTDPINTAQCVYLAKLMLSTSKTEFCLFRDLSYQERTVSTGETAVVPLNWKLRLPLAILAFFCQ